MKFDGPQEAVIRKSVMHVLRGGGYDVVGARELDAAAKSAGAPLDSNDGFKTVAKELAISSFVTGEVSKKKAKLSVRNGADGAVSGEGSFSGANPKKVAAEVRDAFARRLGSAIDRGRAPAGAKKPTAAPAPEPEEPESNAGGDDDDAQASGTKAEGAGEASAGAAAAGADESVAKKAPEPSSEGGAGVGPRALDVSAGFRGFTRNLSYNQDLYRQLREYKLTLGPAAAVSAVFFPAAFVTGGILANLGIEANLEQAFGVASNVPAGGGFPNGATFPTVIHDFSGGVRFRYLFGVSNEVSVSVGGGEHAFVFRSGSDGAPRDMLDIPDVIYRYARAGVDVRIVLPAGLTVGAGAAYRHILNHGGQIAAHPFFPFATVMGMDLNARLGYQVTPSIEARLGVDLRRYGFNMHSAALDRDNGDQIAGGAIDQYLSFTLGAAYVFGGVTASASPSADEPPADESPAPKKKKKKKMKGAESDADAGESGQGKGDGAAE